MGKIAHYNKSGYNLMKEVKMIECPNCGDKLERVYVPSYIGEVYKCRLCGKEFFKTREVVEYKDEGEVHSTPAVILFEV